MVVFALDHEQLSLYEDDHRANIVYSNPSILLARTASIDSDPSTLGNNVG
jgi:hypothetical protein